MTSAMLTKKIIRLVLTAMLLCLPLGVSAQGVVKGPKKAPKQTTAPAKKKAPAAQTPKTPQGCFDRGMAAFNRDNYSDAMKWFLKAAEDGHASAQRWLGVMYNIGYGVRSDYAEAAKWFRMAAEQGDADAQDSLGQLYEYGNGVPKDYTEALKWYRKSAEQGNIYGIRSYGRMFERGTGVARDYDEAAKWYRKGAALGDGWSRDALKRIGK